MALPQPFSADRLPGFDRSCLFAAYSSSSEVIRGGVGKVVADVLEKGDSYYLRGVSELSRLRLEAGAPVSRDVTRREAEVRYV